MSHGQSFAPISGTRRTWSGVWSIQIPTSRTRSWSSAAALPSPSTTKTSRSSYRTRGQPEVPFQASSLIGLAWQSLGWLLFNWADVRKWFQHSGWVPALLFIDRLFDLCQAQFPQFRNFSLLPISMLPLICTLYTTRNNWPMNDVCSLTPVTCTFEMPLLLKNEGSISLLHLLIVNRWISIRPFSFTAVFFQYCSHQSSAKCKLLLNSTTSKLEKNF